MSIVVQAGHKTSKSKQVMEKLYERGLSKPADSYTHKMNSEQVSEKLYKVFAREDMSSASEKLADNIMIDLLLANLDSENWGWESEKNLATLEYWQQTEPDVRVILVFDHPKNVLSNLGDKKITTELLDQVMSDWVSYHQTMLDFFEKNQDTAMLIEGGGALKNINALGVQVKHIAKTLQLKSSWQVISGTAISIENNNSSSQLQLNVVKDNIFAEIINKYPEAIKIFNTLLDKTSIKKSNLIYKTKRTSLNSLMESLNYLQLEEEKKSSLANIEKSLLKKDQESQRLNRELQESNSKRQDLENKLKKINNRIKEQTQSVNSDIEKENELLIVQIHQLQEGLERYYEEKKKSSLANIEKILVKKDQENQRLNRELQESNSKRQELEGKLKKINNRIEEQTQSVNSDIEKENELLIVQIYQIQEELERYYIENKNLKNNEVSKSERTIRDSGQKPTHYGAAERIKQDLPYRLGEKIVKAKQPKQIVSLPFVLAKEYSDFQKNELSAENLPPIELYKDAYEAEKIKKQLSYKLGVVVTTEVKSYKGLLSLPLKIVKEVVDFKLKVKAK